MWHKPPSNDARAALLPQLKSCARAINTFSSRCRHHPKYLVLLTSKSILTVIEYLLISYRCTVFLPRWRKFSLRILLAVSSIPLRVEFWLSARWHILLTSKSPALLKGSMKKFQCQHIFASGQLSSHISAKVPTSSSWSTILRNNPDKAIKINLRYVSIITGIHATQQHHLQSMFFQFVNMTH